MYRYFFNAETPQGTIEDLSGVEIADADLSTVRDDVLEVIRETTSELATAGETSSVISFIVVDGTGRTIMRIPVTESADGDELDQTCRLRGSTADAPSPSDGN